MAQVTIEVPDGEVPYVISIPAGEGAQVVEAVCSEYHFTGNDPDPQDAGHILTANEFAHQQIIVWLYGVVSAFQGKQAAATARQAAIDAVLSGITITRIDLPLP